MEDAKLFLQILGLGLSSLERIKNLFGKPKPPKNTPDCKPHDDAS